MSPGRETTAGAVEPSVKFKNSSIWFLQFVIYSILIAEC